MWAVDKLCDQAAACEKKTIPENISDNFANNWHPIGIFIPVRWINKIDDIESVLRCAYQVLTLPYGTLRILQLLFENLD